MPTEAELRQRMQEEGATPIDAAAVVRLARRRRLPRRIALGATVSLAVIGIGVAGVSGIQGMGPMSASDSAGGAAQESAADDSHGVPAPAAAPGLCGTVSPAEDTPNGLEFGTQFPDTVEGGAEITGVVTLRNTTEAPVAGTVAEPAIVIVSDGVVVGYGNDRTPLDSRTVDLAPGESQQIEIGLAVVGCGGESAALEPGAYELVSVVDFESDTIATSDGAPGRLSSPVEPIIVR